MRSIKIPLGVTPPGGLEKQSFQCQARQLAWKCDAQGAHRAHCKQARHQHASCLKVRTPAGKREVYALQLRTRLAHVITQSPPGPKGPLALYVHTQETVDHTLLRVAVCSTTVVSKLSVHVRLSDHKKKSNYKQGRIYLICRPNASKTGNHNDHRLL